MVLREARCQAEAVGLQVQLALADRLRQLSARYGWHHAANATLDPKVNGFSTKQRAEDHPQMETREGRTANQMQWKKHARCIGSRAM